nr:PDDEXK nuclease domain-containing protein [Peptoniphilus raoultii]
MGIILCTDKYGVQAEYALGNLSNKIFASKYTLYIPNREELEEQVEKVIKKYKGK